MNDDNKRHRAALRYSGLMTAFWEGSDELPEPVPIDSWEVRNYDESWQQRWERLTGRKPNAIDGEGKEDQALDEGAVRLKAG